jgi:hypothetical protein
MQKPRILMSRFAVIPREPGAAQHSRGPRRRRSGGGDKLRGRCRRAGKPRADAVMSGRRKAMVRQAYSQAAHQQLATYADVHYAFKHINEAKALAILALRPTKDEVEEVGRRLGGPKRRTQTHRDAGVVAAIIGVLASVDAD